MMYGVCVSVCAMCGVCMFGLRHVFVCVACVCIVCVCVSVSGGVMGVCQPCVAL
jgi:hypothetical protein